MATPLETLVVTIETNLAKFQQETSQMAKAVDKMTSQIDSALGQVKTAFAGVTAGIALGKVAQMADEYNVLQARIQQATKATGDYLGVSQQLQRISQQTGASLKDSTDVFQRLSLAAGNLGASNKQLLDLTATVQKLGVLGGASTQALNAGLLQFGQAMGAGTVRAEEFNSIIENMPLVAQKIAEGMGMTTAELRKLVLAGKVASKDVFESLMRQSESISKEFEKMPISLGRAMANLKGSIEAALGKLDSSIGVTKTLAAGLQKVADNATLAVNAMTGLAVGTAIFKVLTIDIAATTAAMTSLAASVTAATGGFNLIVAGIAASVAALVAFRDEQFKIGDSTVTITNLVKAAWETMTGFISTGAKSIQGAWNNLVASANNAISDFYAKLADGETRAGTMRYAFKQLWDLIAMGADKASKAIEKFSAFMKPIVSQAIDDLPIVKGFKAAAQVADVVVKRADEITKAQQKMGEVSEKAAKAAAAASGDEEKEQKKHQKAVEWLQKLVGEWDRQAEVVGKVTAQEKVMMDLEKAIAEIKKKHLTDEEKSVAIAQLRVDAAARVYNLNQVAYTKELDSLDKIIEKWNSKAASSKQMTDEQKIQLAVDKEIEEINKKHIGQLDKEVAIMKVRAAAQTEIANKKAAEVAKEREQFQKRLDDLNVQAEAAERQLKGLPEITEQMKLQAQIEKQIKEGKTENLDLLNQQLSVLKHIDETQQKTKEQKYLDEELKRIDEIAAGYKDQQEAIWAKANGYENMLPLLKEERKIQEDIKKIQESTVFSQSEKDTKTQELQQKLQTIRDGHAVTQQFNAQVEAQEKLVNKITGSTTGYYNQIADLREAFQRGQITLHQYTEAWRKLQDGTKGASDAGKEFGDKIGKALQDGIVNGKKMTDVIKDLGKELKNMAIQKLLIDPIKEKAGLAFDAIGRNLFGLGRGNYNQPGLPPGVAPPGQLAGLPNNPLAQNAAASSVAAPGNLLPAALQSSTPSMAPIYSYGPVTLNGGSVAMNNPQFPAMSFNNAGSGAGTFNGGSGFLGSGLNGLVNGAKGGFGGLLGGMGGLLSSPVNLLKNLLGGGGQVAGPINPASQSIFGGLGGLLNPLGLLGGIGKAAGSTIGGDTIFKNIAPLFNPLGLFKGLGSAIGSVFGGAREFGGNVWGGQSFLVGERGPELFTPSTSGFITPNRQLDMQGVMQTPGGTPLYQQMQGYMPDWNSFNSLAFAGQDGMQGDTIQRLLAKRDAYFGMSPADQMHARTTGAGYFNSVDNFNLQRALHTIPLSVMNQLQELDMAQLQAGTQAILDNDFSNPFTKGWASDTQSNKTWAAIARALPPSLRGFYFASGNQAANNMLRWSHRGVNPGNLSLSYANALDFANDKLMPVGGYQNFSMGYQSNFAGGPTAPRADAYAGDSAHEYFMWGGNDPKRMITNDTVGWGNGIGYNYLGWQPTGTPFKNNSLLMQGRSVYHPEPIAALFGAPIGPGVKNYNPTPTPLSAAGLQGTFANPRPSLSAEGLQGLLAGTPLLERSWEGLYRESQSLMAPQKMLPQLGKNGALSASTLQGVLAPALPAKPTPPMMPSTSNTPLTAYDWGYRGPNTPSGSEWTLGYIPGPHGEKFPLPTTTFNGQPIKPSPGLSNYHGPDVPGNIFERGYLRTPDAWTMPSSSTTFDRISQNALKQLMSFDPGMYANPADAWAAMGSYVDTIKQTSGRSGAPAGYDGRNEAPRSPMASATDWSKYHVPSPFTSGSTAMDWTQFLLPSPLDSMPRPRLTAMDNGNFLGIGGGSGGLSGLLGGLMGGDNIIKDILPLLNPLGFAKGISSAAGSTLGGLTGMPQPPAPPWAPRPAAVQSSDPFVAAKNAASDSWRQLQALGGSWANSAISGATDFFRSHSDTFKGLWGEYQQWNPTANTNLYTDGAKLLGQAAYSGWNNNVELQIRTNMALQDFAQKNPWSIPYIQKTTGGLRTLGSLLGPMPNRQLGGPVDPGFYQWNENGREYFATSRKGEVIPASEINKKQGVVVNVHNYASSTHEASVEETAAGIIDVVFREIQRALPAVPQKVRL